MKELKQHGKTIVFVSHSLPQVREFCDTAIWIEAGTVREYDEVNLVCDHYSDYVESLNKLSAEEKKKVNEGKFQKRVIPDAKDGFWDKVLTFFQRHM